MRALQILLLVFVGGRLLPACSDDGDYTPVERPIDESVQACELVDTALCDAGSITDQKDIDAGKD